MSLNESLIGTDITTVNFLHQDQKSVLFGIFEHLG